jgi:carbon monoxide dehydrogenase subunit G
VKVALEKTFPLPGPPGPAWEFLQNIESVAACMPGAKITERLDTGRYKGTMTVRIGPATMSFRGDVEVRDVDQAARSLTLVAKGTDSTGTSGATMDLKARIEANADGTSQLVGASEVSMSGKAAAFGGRMMNSVADQIMQQFAANFAAQVTALAARQATPEAPAGSPPTGKPDATVAAAGATGASPGDVAPVALRSTLPAPPLAASELNGLNLAWAVFKDWLRGLFRKKAA